MTKKPEKKSRTKTTDLPQAEQELTPEEAEQAMGGRVTRGDDPDIIVGAGSGPAGGHVR